MQSVAVQVIRPWNATGGTAGDCADEMDEAIASKLNVFVPAQLANVCVITT